MTKNFALIGAAGYIAPRHMQAIRETGNDLIAAVDPHDSVGQIDQYFPHARFFTEIERFDRYLEKCRRGPESKHVDYVSICSPNYLHDAHVRLALRVRAHAICEKPMVLTPWNLDALEELEAEYGRKVHAVLQLRNVPAVRALRKKVADIREKADICLTYITRRGAWYDVSWKGQQEKSGGVAMNIGIHFFDLLMWLFGSPESSELHLREPNKMSGYVELERARVRWFLSTDAADLPVDCVQAGKYAFRSMSVDGEELELSNGFTDLHTEVYRQVLEGQGYGISDARPAIELVHQLNKIDTVSPTVNHPSLKSKLTDHRRAA